MTDDARSRLLERLLGPAQPEPGPAPEPLPTPPAGYGAPTPATAGWAGEAWDDELTGRGPGAPGGGSRRTDLRRLADAWAPRLRRVPWRPVRDGLALLGLGYAAFLFSVIAPQDRGIGDDAYAYWSVSAAHPYAIPEGQLGAFPYSPPIVRLFEPLGNFSWDAFLVLWLGLLLATVIWLGWGKTLLLLAFPPVAIELYHGNVNLLIGAAIALGFRYPASWAFVLLTKITPGIGLLWFVARREWRPLAIALGVTGVIVAVSVALDRPLWNEWASSMTRDAGAGLGGIAAFLWLRLPIAGALVVWGARTDRAWTVPLAAALAMPTLFIAVFAVLAALPAIARPELRPLPLLRPGAAAAR